MKKDLKKVFLWIKRCDILMQNQNVSNYNSSNIDFLLNDLIKERTKPFNKASLIKIFNKHGLYLVIEEALKGTKVRGCTKVIGNNPAVYMTCYLKEKSSFYFALYHELGHVKSDYNRVKSKVIIDGDDTLEKRADLFAVNQMIDEKTYKLILENFDDKENICIKRNIPLCFLYSRLAHDKIIKYTDKLYLESREKINYHD